MLIYGFLFRSVHIGGSEVRPAVAFIDVPPSRPVRAVRDLATEERAARVTPRPRAPSPGTPRARASRPGTPWARTPRPGAARPDAPAAAAAPPRDVTPRRGARLPERSRLVLTLISEIGQLITYKMCSHIFIYIRYHTVIAFTSARFYLQMSSKFFAYLLRFDEFYILFLMQSHIYTWNFVFFLL